MILECPRFSFGVRLNDPPLLNIFSNHYFPDAMESRLNIARLRREHYQANQTPRKVFFMARGKMVNVCLEENDRLGNPAAFLCPLSLSPRSLIAEETYYAS